MKFTVNAGELSAALRGPCDRTKQHTVIPILKHVRCEASGGKLMLLGHDLDSSSESSVDAEVAIPGACAIPAAPLAQWIAGLHKAATIVAELAGKDIVIKSGRSRCKLPILDAADMPAALSAEGGFKFSASHTDLEQLFVRPRPTIDVKEPRTCFQGLYLHNDGGKVCSVTTNGNFLMRFSADINSKQFSGAIIPRSAADEIVKIGVGEITISDRIVSVSAGDRTYSSKIIDATFPEHYRKVIPELSGPHATVDRETVLECLSRLRAVGDFSESNLIDINIGDGDLEISVTGVADGAEKIECEATETAFVCLRSDQFLEAVKALKGETVSLYIESAQKPVRVADASEPSAVAVLVPCASKTVRAVAA